MKCDRIEECKVKVGRHGVGLGDDEREVWVDRVRQQSGKLEQMEIGAPLLSHGLLQGHRVTETPTPQPW